MKKVKVLLEVQYDGHSVKRNTSIDLKFKVPYSELVNCLNLLQLLNCNVRLIAKVNNKNKYEIGTFYLNNLSIDRDGESNIKFNSEVDYVELNNINLLTEKETIIKLLCTGEVQEEDDEE